MNWKELFSPLPAGACGFASVQEHLLDCRRKKDIPDGAQSILVVLFPYYLGEEAYRSANVSRYAVPMDYHEYAMAVLNEGCRTLQKQYPGSVFVPFCDNSPIPEVRAAALAGLGAVGKNGLLLHSRYGSYCFIGEIVTDRYFPPDAAGEISSCSGCGACEKSCPAAAILSAGIDRANCLSAVSQQKKELTQAQKQLLCDSGCAWGCDVCQLVCPVNRKAEITPIDAFFRSAVPLVTEQTAIQGRAYAWRGEKVIRRNLEIISAGKKK